MAETKETRLALAQKSYLENAFSALRAQGCRVGDAEKKCGLEMINCIQDTLTANKLSWRDCNQNDLQIAVQKAANLRLSASAGECYITLRKDRLVFGIQGDGYDALVQNFGSGVKTVHKFWEVREGDKFTPPRYKGLKIDPPEWEPSGKGRVIKIVYPIEKTDGSVEYIISERSDVKRNLLAHISNNLLKETFGIAKSTYAATEEQKQKINARKRELKARAAEMDIEEMLKDEELDKYISPAWKEGHSSESMIVRKMRVNAMRKYPKNFSDAQRKFISDAERAIDETLADERGEDRRIDAEIIVSDDYEVMTEENPKPDIDFELENFDIPTEETEESAD